MQKINQQKGIISLAVIFTVGFFAISLVIINSLGALEELKKNRNTVFGDRSFYTAEAAAAEGTYQFIHDTSYPGTTSLPDTQLLNNSLDGNIVVNVLWPYAKVISEAENNLTQREVTYTLIVYPEGLAFDYAIFSEEDILLSGNASTSGKIFSNQNIDLQSNALEVNGGAFSVGDITGFVENIEGPTSTNVTPLPVPQIDLESYRGEATCLATTTGESADCVPDITQTAVVFASTTASVTIGGNHTDLSGSIITKGDLTITGGNYTATGDYAALVVGGDLEVRAGTTINGVVYVEGSTKLIGGGGPNEININGTMLSIGGTSDVGGNVKINYNPAIVENWVSLFGLATSTSTSTPRIIDRGEN